MEVGRLLVEKCGVPDVLCKLRKPVILFKITLMERRNEFVIQLLKVLYRSNISDALSVTHTLASCPGDTGSFGLDLLSPWQCRCPTL